MSRRTAVVVGGSITGMLAAAVLAEHADVTVVERDLLPDGPEPRRGLPQARHAHVLWSGGVKAMESLLPGLTEELTARGAWCADIMTDLVSKAPSGQWFRRFTHSWHTNVVCSRDLLDCVVRDRVLRNPRVTLRSGAEAVGLAGGPGLVTGVDLVAGGGGARERLAAGLVVDASGRSGRAPVWLAELGLPPVPERTVDAGIGYASRLYRAPAGAVGRFPVVNVQADPHAPVGRGGILNPVEGGRWLVTLAGSREGRPTSDPDAFVPFARSLPHPVIGELLAQAEPLGPVVTTRSTANRRRYYERARRLPAGFVILGDAIAGYNPVYGHGLSAAAQSVVALREVLRRHDLTDPLTARRVQRAAARPVENAWNLAVGQDVFHPDAADRPPAVTERLLARYVDRAVDAGARNPRALRILLDVMSMERPATRLMRPDMLFLLLLGRRKPLLGGPPLTGAELRAAGLPVPADAVFA
ncbi:FAD-dependent monooxygenase [Streptomyces sp. MJP52]|uniref:FAD-dependent oxidoreductase n=1 Tax=Streptomyces sp. MJP52 TaxID=2940555 RepID=UPI0024765388|nr:FAD-dependent monooxygenase [Streptomyces sp. MJP52]MDH6224065.1 2-polyprenyl-6-methoxyphenol hydroxylase-like FAD-dependent oxidoreductase [Streptomyces sp. MJP52]